MIPKIPVEGIAPEDYTVQQFNQDIREIILENLTAVNPHVPRFGEPTKCLYYEPESETRCLIGTWLHARGHEYQIQWDQGGGTSAWQVLDKLGYSASVCDRAGDLQSRADNDSEPQPWGNLLHIP